MAWEGYALFGGNEIINVARTSAYARSANANWFKGCVPADDGFAQMLGDDMGYTSPLQDDAPWTEEEYPESYDFYGFYPLEIKGIEDSTRSATVFESTIDGGIPGHIRHSTKQVVFSGVLIGSSQAAVEYGMRWLKRALLASPCGENGLAACLGDDFCYLSSEPCLPEPCPGNLDQNPVNCLDDYWRTLKKFAVITGPTVTAKRTMSDGCATMWSVTFTGVAGNPFEYGREVPIITGFPYNSVYAPGIIGYTDTNGFIMDDSGCTVGISNPLQDPSCIVQTPPLTPPVIALGCYTPPVNWLRKQFTIPKTVIPLWDSVVPIINVHSVGDTRNVRIRFYADTYDDTNAAIDDPCAYCGDFVISWLPGGYTLTIDGPNERVFATAPGGDQMRADSLVFGGDGNPMVWPELSCGFGYVVTVDTEQTGQTPPSIDLALVARSV